jgi:hypothetical protein
MKILVKGKNRQGLGRIGESSFAKRKNIPLWNKL